MTQPEALQPQAVVNQQVIKDEAPADRLTKTKTLYDVSYFQIFMRNFLAGFARGLGGVFIYLCLILISAYLFFLYAWPTIKPLLGSYQNMLNIFSGSGGVSLDKLPRFDLPAPTQTPLKIDPTIVQQVIDQMKK